MKKQIYILVVIVAFTCSMCNTSKKEDVVTTKKTSVPEKEDQHSSMTASDSLKLVNHQIEIKGEVEFPLQLNIDSLQKMKVATISNFKITGQNGEIKKNDKTSKGVLLKDILEKAKIIQNGHKDRNFYIVARASDNYKATFSWAEIFNNSTGENTYVLFEENGKPIKNGEMVLICKNDIKTGPRHVYWLKSIEVYRVK
ncbi:molybdopterin-dependent oxidoreductase [Flavobacterium aquidurense]|uniref:Sulfite oxidase-like oxidoreductase n=1 Tax=Flavobacterium aquidurense TaxID=362413 RepID=A0A0Q0WX57_9FLAO|nr:molybdopterin-dependent oxidoreductase [Flavobacterium aquidurense]KQB40871.1 sulfite oxidase-like oxidoreductase [Flavobacterium aquidurense]